MPTGILAMVLSMPNLRVGTTHSSCQHGRNYAIRGAEEKAGQVQDYGFTPLPRRQWKGRDTRCCSGLAWLDPDQQNVIPEGQRILFWWRGRLRFGNALMCLHTDELYGPKVWSMKIGWWGAWIFSDTAKGEITGMTISRWGARDCLCEL